MQPGEEDVRDHCGEGRHGISRFPPGSGACGRSGAQGQGMHAPYCSGIYQKTGTGGERTGV